MDPDFDGAVALSVVGDVFFDNDFIDRFGDLDIL
jgi:hypothetical protein